MNTNAHETAKFLAATDAKTKAAILANIAAHYGVSPAQAEAEITDEGAESLLDYVTGPARYAVLALMQRHGIRKEVA